MTTTGTNEEEDMTAPKNKGGRPKLGVDVSMVRLSVCEQDRNAISILREALADKRGKQISLSEAVRTAVRQEALRWTAQGYKGSAA